MLVADRPRAAPKEGDLFRHQPFALAKSEGTMGRALIPSTLHWGFKNRSPALHQEERAVFSEEEEGWESSTPAQLGSSWRTGIMETRLTSLETQTQQNVIMISRFCAKKL